MQYIVFKETILYWQPQTGVKISCAGGFRRFSSNGATRCAVWGIRSWGTRRANLIPISTQPSAAFPAGCLTGRRARVCMQTLNRIFQLFNLNTLEESRVPWHDGVLGGADKCRRQQLMCERDVAEDGIRGRGKDCVSGYVYSLELL